MIIFCCILLFVGCVSGVLLTHECLHNEIYKSCMFFNELTCWETEDRRVRVKTPAKRLQHCWGGCVCDRNLVRAYPKGPCVLSFTCVDSYFLKTLKELPPSFMYV